MSSWQNLRNITTEYLQSWKNGRNHAPEFAELETFCLFLGYPRSSHSLLGSLIDAHPDAVIAHEQDVLRYLKYGFSREQLFALLLQNSAAFTAAGRTWTGYSYAVANQHQGTYERLRVIGDKKGANSARRLRRDPRLLHKLQQKVQLPLRVIHVVRNPFDNISTMAFRDHDSQVEAVTREVLERTLRRYFGLVEVIAESRGQAPETSFLDVQIERFLANPAQELGRVCAYLNLTPHPAYLQDCQAIVFAKPRQTRTQFPWDSALIEQVLALSSQYTFLQNYTFADDSA